MSTPKCNNCKKPKNRSGYGYCQCNTDYGITNDTSSIFDSSDSSPISDSSNNDSSFDFGGGDFGGAGSGGDW